MMLERQNIHESVPVASGNRENDTGARKQRPAARAEVVEGILFEERDVKRLLVEAAVLTGIAGFALGYWLGVERER